VPGSDQRGVRMSGWDDTLWVGLLPEGDGVRQPLHLDVCDGGGGLHAGTDVVWQDVLLGYGPSVREWNLHHLYRLGCRVHGGQHVLHARPGLYRGRVSVDNLRRPWGVLHFAVLRGVHPLWVRSSRLWWPMHCVGSVRRPAKLLRWRLQDFFGQRVSVRL
jgi:hypothetical protein